MQMMTDEPENLTLRLLQELRQEMRDMRGEMNEQFADLTNRLDGNTLLLNIVAGLVHDHETRIDKLESR